MWQDPIVQDVRKAGEELAKQANYDLHTFFQNLRNNEKKENLKVVSRTTSRSSRGRSGRWNFREPAYQNVIRKWIRKLRIASQLNGAVRRKKMSDVVMPSLYAGSCEQDPEMVRELGSELETEQPIQSA